MNKILIVDASVSDGRIMSGLLTRSGYDPIGVDSIEAGKVEAAKLLNITEKTLISLRKKYGIDSNGGIQS